MGLLDIFKSKKIGTTKTLLQPLRDPKILPTSIEDFKEHHIKFLRRLNKHPVNESFSGIITKEIDIPNFMPILQKLELITLAPYETSLYLTKNETLKAFLKESSLKVSGSKKELINRIVQNIPETAIRNSEKYSDFYILTDLGQKTIDESYDKLNQQEQKFFKTAIDLILSQKINAAYRMICKRNAEKPIPPGLYCDWAEWYYRGLEHSQTVEYITELKDASNKTLAACAIYSIMSGDSLHTVYSNAKSVYGLDDDDFEELEMLSSIFIGNRDTASYISSNIEHYEFVATLDKRTCPICGELDGKIFPVKGKKVGVNFPPMHAGCRCTTVSAIDGHIPKQRYARNPITNKSELIPFTTYSEWIKQFK